MAKYPFLFRRDQSRSVSGHRIHVHQISLKELIIFSMSVFLLTNHFEPLIVSFCSNHIFECQVSNHSLFLILKDLISYFISFFVIFYFIPSFKILYFSPQDSTTSRFILFFPSYSFSIYFSIPNG